MHGKWQSQAISFVSASVALATVLAAQSAPTANRGQTLDACALATNAEVVQVAEEKPELAGLWQDPEPVLGGKRCEYSGGSIEVYDGATAAADLERSLKTFQVDKEPRTPVSGIGSRAFFMIPYPGDDNRNLGLLAVYAGQRVLALTLDAHNREPVTATRPRLERLAKLVLARLE